MSRAYGFEIIEQKNDGSYCGLSRHNTISVVQARYDRIMTSYEHNNMNYVASNEHHRRENMLCPRFEGRGKLVTPKIYNRFRTGPRLLQIEVHLPNDVHACAQYEPPDTSVASIWSKSGCLNADEKITFG